MYELTLVGQDKMDQEQKDTIIEEFQTLVTPDDIIASMLSFLDVDSFPGSARRIQMAVNELKNDYPEILTDFIFSDGDIYPFSRLLERVLFRLESGGIIGMVNPDFERYTISDESKIAVRREIVDKIFPREQKDTLAEMGNKFQSLILASE